MKNTDEGEVLKEARISLGIRYLFGGSLREQWTRGIVGETPHNQVQAPVWTEYPD